MCSSDLAGLDGRAILIVFLVALVIRLAFVFYYGISAPPVRWGDDSEYDRIARTQDAHRGHPLP